MKGALVTQIVHSRGVAATVAVIVGALLAFFWFSDPEARRVADPWFVLPSAGYWLPFGIIDFAGAITGGAAITGVIALLNRRFNFLRTTSALYVPFFALMLAGTPKLATQFYTGQVLALAVGAALMLFFDVYRSPRASNHVFLVFFLLSGLASTQYSFIFYLPVMLLCMAQMGVMNGRTLVAALLGLITPWWILFGLGISDPSEIEFPMLSTIFSNPDFHGMALTVFCAGFTALMLGLVLVLNLFKAIAYNARTRAMNGAICVVAVGTVIAMLVDYNNFTAYVPTLDGAAAIQAAHFFAQRRSDRSGYVILSLFAVYLVLFVCQTAISE